MAVLHPCVDTLWKITKAGDAVTCSVHLQAPNEALTARRGFQSRIILRTMEIKSCSEVDAVFQVFECDDSHIGTGIQNC